MAKKKKKSRSKNFNWNNKQMYTWLGYASVTLVLCVCSYFVGRNQRIRTVAKQVAAYVETVPGMKMHVADGTIVFTGEVKSLQDYNKARGIAHQLSSGLNGLRIANMLNLTEEAKNATLKQVRREIRNSRVRPRFVNRRLVLEGTVRNDFEADRAVELAKAVLMLGPNGSTRETAAEKMGATDNHPGGHGEIMILDMLKVAGGR